MEFFHVTNQQKHTYYYRCAIADIAHKQLKYVATRHVLRPVNVSKCIWAVPRTTLGSLQCSPDTLV